MKILQVHCSWIFSEIVMTMGLLIAACAPISASDSHDDSLNNSLSAMSVQDSVSDDSMELFGDDTPDVLAYYKEDFVNHTHYSEQLPRFDHPSTKKYDKDGIILRNSLIKIMDHMLYGFTRPDIASDDWLREINGRNAKFLDLRVEARILPGSKKTQQTGVLRIVPQDVTTVDDVFSEKAKRIVERFKQRGIDLDVQLYLFENLQDFKDCFS